MQRLTKLPVLRERVEIRAGELSRIDFRSSGRCIRNHSTGQNRISMVDCSILGARVPPKKVDTRFEERNRKMP